MGIFQNQLNLSKYQINEMWLDECSQKLKKSVIGLNLALCKAPQLDVREDYGSRIFEQVCTLFIQNKSELKLNNILKLQVLKIIVNLIEETKDTTLNKSLKFLSKQFIENNIFEEYSNEEIRDLYIFSYLDVNDLVATLAIQERFFYEHHARLEVTSEVLALSKNLKIILPAQKLSLFYTRYKQYLLKQLINPQHKFNHIYQNINFLIKYLINTYIYQLTGTKLDQL